MAERSGFAWRKSLPLWLACAVVLAAPAFRAVAGETVEKPTPARAQAAPAAVEREARAEAQRPETEADFKPLKQLDAEVLAARLTAAGYMIDMRFHIKDGKKAAPLFDRKVKPYIIEEKTGARLMVPVSAKLGALRQAPQHVYDDRTYFMFFANPARRIASGDKITLVIGRYRQQHIVVE